MDADGQNPANLTNNAASDSEPAFSPFSPDGSKIAFTSSRDGGTDIFVMDAETGLNPTNLTNDAGEAAGGSEPVFSPDGSKIAFTGSGGQLGSDEIFVMDADGQNPINLTNNAANDLRPAFSPDGSKIAFASNRDTPGAGLEIYVMDVDGELPPTEPPTRLTNNETGDDHPAFSPDGSKIAFNSSRDGDQEIYVMDADGNQSPTPLTNNATSDVDPDWGVSTNTAPDCSAVGASPKSLKPASKKQFQQITLGGATDADLDPLAFHIDGVSQDEPVTGAFAGDSTTPDAQLTAAGANSDKVRVRAEANPNGNGRVYRISYTVSDGTDDCSGVAKVGVASKKGAVDDGNTTSYDSFTGNAL